MSGSVTSAAERRTVTGTVVGEQAQSVAVAGAQVDAVAGGRLGRAAGTGQVSDIACVDDPQRLGVDSGPLTPDGHAGGAQGFHGFGELQCSCGRRPGALRGAGSSPGDRWPSGTVKRGGELVQPASGTARVAGHCRMSAMMFTGRTAVNGFSGGPGPRPGQRQVEGSELLPDLFPLRSAIALIVG